MVTQISAFTRSCNEGISRILISDVYVSEIYYTTNRPQNLIIKKYTAIWDTGATNTVITKKVMMECKLWSIGMTKVIHAGGEATTNSYLVNLYLPNNLEVRGVRVSEGILGEKVDVLIGMDIISKGDFAVTNYNGRTVFTFRYPSVECIDFVKTPYKEKPIKVNNKNFKK
jgi:hypothetical protein